jgi:hypothetical protein
MALTPTDPTKAQLWINGTAPNQTLDFYIPRGAKGEPGGIIQGTEIGTNNLNTILVPGMYRTALGSNVTALNNYPSGIIGVSVIVTVTQGNNGAGGQLVQTVEPAAGIRLGQVMWKRGTSDNGTTWSTWRAFTSTRVDQAAGRAIYQWDDVNNRDQLMYGDTGVRRVETDFKNGWTCAIASLRRVNNVISFGLYTVNPTSQTNIAAYTLPAGFKPASYGGNVAFPIRYSGATNTDWMQITSAGDVQPPTGAISGNGYICVSTWTTTDAWPTTLPGTAQGSIPNT